MCTSAVESICTVIPASQKSVSLNESTSVNLTFSIGRAVAATTEAASAAAAAAAMAPPPRRADTDMVPLLNAARREGPLRCAAVAGLRESLRIRTLAATPVRG